MNDIQRLVALVACTFSLLIFRAAAFAAVADGPPRSRTNIVIIMADDLGYGDLGPYGATKIRTPHCDRLAKEGRRFTDAHSPSAVCSPTRFGLITGTYPWRERRVPRHLLASEPLVIRDGEPTLPGLLKAAGYATGCVGKWHLGAQRQDPIDWNKPLKPGPTDVGFDYYFGVINSHNQAPFVWVENHTILDRQRGEVIEVQGNQKQTKGRVTRDEHDGERVLAGKAVEFIDRNKDKPFFLYYPTSAVHNPITPGAAWKGKSEAGTYGDYVQEFDWAVGQVLHALDRHKLTDRTLVIVTSDNGGVLSHAARFGHKTNGPLRAQKGTIYEGGHRVAFLARWPGHVPAGTTSDETICHVDMMATVCAAAEVPLPQEAGPDSHNVLPAFLGQQSDKPLREATVCVSQHAADFSIRQGPWKLIVKGGAATGNELYHLGDDLAESKDVAAAHGEVVERLLKLLEKYKTGGRSRP